MTYKDMVSYASLPPCTGTTCVATQTYELAHVTNSMSRTPSQTELTFLRLDYTTHGLLLHMLLHNIWADTTCHDLHRKLHWVSWDYSTQHMDLDEMWCHTTYALDTRKGWRKCIGCLKLQVSLRKKANNYSRSGKHCGVRKHPPHSLHRALRCGCQTHHTVETFHYGDFFFDSILWK